MHVLFVPSERVDGPKKVQTSLPLKWSKPKKCEVGVAQNQQNQRARLTQVIVFGSLYQGAILVHAFEPQPSWNGDGLANFHLLK